MRVSLSEKAFIKRLSKKRTAQVLLPFFLLVIFLGVAITPHIAFASWWNPIDWVQDFISDLLIAFSTALYFLGFGLVRIGVDFTTFLISTPAVSEKWQLMRNFTLTIFGLFIIIIAAMNILKVKIEEWGVNKMIPKLALAAFVVMFSKYVCITIVNFSNIISSVVASSMNFNLFQPFSQLGDMFANFCQDCASGPKLYAAWLLLLVSVIGFIFLAALFLILLIRALVLILLIVVSPLAFALYVLPWTNKVFTKWWDMFLKWTFFYPICLTILVIGVSLSMDAHNTGGNQVNSIMSGILKSVPLFGNDAATQMAPVMAQFAFTMIAFLTIPLAMILPLSLLGQAGKMINNAMKGAGKAAGGKAYKSSVIPGVRRSPKALLQAGMRRGLRPFGSRGPKLGYGYDKMRDMNREMVKEISKTPLSKEERRNYARGLLGRGSPAFNNLSNEKQAWIRDFETKGGGRNEMIDYLADKGEINAGVIANPQVQQRLQQTGDWNKAIRDGKLFHVNMHDSQGGELQYYGNGDPIMMPTNLNEEGLGPVSEMITPSINQLQTTQLAGPQAITDENLGLLARDPTKAKFLSDYRDSIHDRIGNVQDGDVHQQTAAQINAELQRKENVINNLLGQAAPGGGQGQGGQAQGQPQVIVPHVGQGNRDNPHQDDIPPNRRL